MVENTGKVLFEDDTPQWYVALGSRWIGPLSAEDVYLKVVGQEISWAHFVWCPGQTDWKRICDTPTFQSAVPGVPAKNLKEAVKEASKPDIREAKGGARKAGGPPPKPKAEERSWFLYYNDAQFGPFSTEEISRFLRIGKIHGRVHIWKDGMEDWLRLEEIEQFADDVAEAKAVRELKKSGGAPKAPAMPSHQAEQVREQRKAPRRPIIAKIYVANTEQLSVAVCRDISIGGMQVLTDRIPGEPGSRIKMNVSPSSDKYAQGSKAIEPFVAEGVIVRLLEDGRGFSFRFDRLPEGSRRAIEDYLRD